MDKYSAKALKISLITHVLLIGTLFVVSSTAGCFSKPKKIEPIDFIIVTEENAAEAFAPMPDDVPDEVKPEPPTPKPTPTPPKPEPVPVPVPIPKPEPIKTPTPVTNLEPKPKPPKKAEVKPKPKPPKKRPFVKGQLIKGPVVGKNNPRKSPTQKRVLSADEIRKALASGARSGNVNQIPNNEQQRCYGLIKRTFTEKFNSYGLSLTGKSPTLIIKFGAGGRITHIALGSSSGDAILDNELLKAARTVRQVSGLTGQFIASYPEIEMRIDND